MTCLLAIASSCSDATSPKPGGPDVTVLISPLPDSVFEGDVITMHASVVDRAGNQIPAASVTWTVSDTTVAKATAATIALLKPGPVRISAQSAGATGTLDLTIGRLVVKQVELTPNNMNLGRGDRVQVTARVLAQGGRELPGRSITFASDDEAVAAIGSPTNPVGGPGFLIAVGPGATTIRATVDGVIGTAHVGVVIADTSFALTTFNGSPIPVLVAADSVEIDGQREFDEVYVDSGVLILSGLLQERYHLTVHVSQYHVFHTGDTVQRELRFQTIAEVDRGVVTTLANGSLSMLSELIGPHLEHSAVPTADGFLVHFHEPGDDFFLDLGYKRLTP